MAEDLASQKKVIEEYLAQSMKNGESWCLLDIRWFKQWKKYVGYDQWDSYSLGDQAVHPGPIDNCSLLKPDTNILREQLVEEIDYMLLPEDGYKKLAFWYGTAPGQEPIVRKVIEQGMFTRQCKVEVYLTELKLCDNSDPTIMITRAFSRADIISNVEQVIRQQFSVPEDKNIRLWTRHTSNTYEPITKKESSLQEAGLYQGQVIVIEVMNDDGTWPRQNRRNIGYNGSSGSLNHDLKNQTSSIHVHNSSISSHNSSVNSHHNSNGYDSYSSHRPGICGLTNLGNTCFMNSALQCMSNVSQLTEYMLSNQWSKELNKENPLGMRGEIAATYSELIREIWSGQWSYTVPRNFKVAVGRFAPQFSGYQQQDSQELMAFLLDGLHEDLNRIRRKPYIEFKDSGGRPDKVVAKEAWNNYKKRNDSIIVDIFHGLLKSTVQCPDCKLISVTFDPFCYLSLPLPIKTERQIEVIWVPVSPEKKPVQLLLTVSKAGSIRDLCEELSAEVGVSPDKMMVTDVYNHRFHKIFPMFEGLSSILERDDIFIYEIPVSDVEDLNPMILPVYFRDKKHSKHNNDEQSSSSSQSLFNHPLLLAVPRQTCTYEHLYQLLLQRMSRFVRVNDELNDWQEEPQDDDYDDDDDDELEEDSSSGNTNFSSAAARKGSWEEDDGGGGTKSGQDNTEPVVQVSTEPHQENVDTTNNRNDPGDLVASCSSPPSISPVKRIFTLMAVNSFGRDDTEVALADDGRPLRMNNQTHIAVDWSKSAKERFFDEKAAQDFEEHKSMKTRNSQKKTVLQLDDCLKLFMKVEKLSEQDPWYCPNCKQHKQASKKFDLWSLPDVLIIHLKRFSYNKYWRDKIDVLVNFPLQGLDLCKYIINEESTDCDLYDLIAVTNHYGSLGGGHYTAFAKNKDDNCWHNFDDSNVSSSSADSVVTKAAYVLVYQRRNIKQVRKHSSKGLFASVTSTILKNSNNSNQSHTQNGVGAAGEGESMITD